MGEAKRRRDRILRIAHERGYSTPPATLAIDGVEYCTKTGRVVGDRVWVPGQRHEINRAKKVAERGTLPAIPLTIEGREFRVIVTGAEDIEVYERKYADRDELVMWKCDRCKTTSRELVCPSCHWKLPDRKKTETVRTYGPMTRVTDHGTLREVYVELEHKHVRREYGLGTPPSPEPEADGENIDV